MLSLMWCKIWILGYFWWRLKYPYLTPFLIFWLFTTVGPFFFASLNGWPFFFMCCNWLKYKKQVIKRNGLLYDFFCCVWNHWILWYRYGYYDSPCDERLTCILRSLLCDSLQNWLCICTVLSHLIHVYMNCCCNVLNEFVNSYLFQFNTLHFAFYIHEFLFQNFWNISFQFPIYFSAVLNQIATCRCLWLFQILIDFWCMLLKIVRGCQ